MLILNDIHVGFQRQAGTTPASREALRSYLLNELRRTVEANEGQHLLIAGDLFDGFNVEERDWLETFLILREHIIQRGELTLVAGNHDWSAKGEKVSSFETLCAALEAISVVRLGEYKKVEPGVWAVAHYPNQDLFNAALTKLLPLVTPGNHVILHANFDNNFVTSSDHSLNVSREVARSFVEAGATLLFAHEHQARTAFDGKLRCLGNQWPTSVADCLGNSVKHSHTLAYGVLTAAQTWSEIGGDGFTDVDWQDLHSPDLSGGFIRVSGKASASEAGLAISTIATFRQKSDAYVVSNAVKVEGVADAQDLPEQFEAAKAFDVLTFIRNNLDPEEMVQVEKLLENQS